MLAIVAPGQGSQSPGFLSPWLDLPGFEDRLTWLSTVAGMDLIGYGTTADAETIRDTAVAQPLIVGAGLVTLLALFPHPADAFGKVGVGAGHSVGEITAAVGTGVLTAEQGMVLVRERGATMATAAAGTATGMSAVVGGDADEVAAAVAAHDLVVAHDNGAGQVVAAGELARLEELKAHAPARARVIPLAVAGAFHTDHMRPAVDVISHYARAITTKDPRTNLLSNRDGAVVHNGREVLRRLVAQISAPARWDLCMRTMGELGVTGVIELPPAGTLTGLIKRALPDVEVVALKTPDDLDAAWELVEKHATESPMDDRPTWRLLVSPVAGTWRAGAATAGSPLERGAAVGAVVGRKDEQPVVAPHGGTVVEWLVEDGDPVSPGQPLVRLHPESVPE